MFGLGKIVSGAVGGLLNKVGLGKLAPVVSGIVNACTGNWVGVAMDVANLANRLTNGKLGFLNKVAQFAPIAQSFLGGGGNIGDIFKSGGLKNLASNLLKNVKNASGFTGAQQGFRALQQGNILGGAEKIFNAFKTAEEFVHNRELFSARSASQYIQLGFGNINQGQ